MNKFVLIAALILLALFVFLRFRLTGIGYYSWILSGVMTTLLMLYPLVWYDILPDSYKSCYPFGYGLVKPDDDIHYRS
jgi:energy-coupling factor transporter transmembrane protein EcfT